MGDWDCYCAICGGPFACRAAFDVDNGDTINEQWMEWDELNWLEKVRLLGYNKKVEGIDKCFITGDGDAGSYGAIDCEIGDDKNVPREDVSANGKISLSAYSEFDPNEPMSFPFHEICYQVFAQWVQYKSTGKVQGTTEISIVDKDVLYKVMLCNHQEYITALEVDYGELTEMVHEQYWYWQPGTEPWLSEPYNNYRIQKFYESLQNPDFNLSPNAILPLRSSIQITSTANTTSKTVQNNPFPKLANEMTLEVLLHLPSTSLKNFILSGLSPIPLSSPSASTFWRRKLFFDHPFLFDLPSLPAETDWLKVYLFVLKLTELTSSKLNSMPKETSQELKDGFWLTNRARIWKVCDQLGELYINELENRGTKIGNEMSFISEQIIEGSSSTQIYVVANPIFKAFQNTTCYFLKDLSEKESGALFKVWFTKGEDEKGKNKLCGIGIADEKDRVRCFGEEMKENGDVFEIRVPRGDWIVGFEFNTEGGEDIGGKTEVGVTGIKFLMESGNEMMVGAQSGDKRVLVVPKNTVLTGLSGELGSHTIQRISLLHHPLVHLSRLQDHQRSNLPSRLWKNSIPTAHPNLHISPYETGYWTPSRSYDTIPFQHLIFGVTKQELAQITGIFSDKRLRNFGVRYVDGREKRISAGTPLFTNDIDGNKVEEKVEEVEWKINGKGGERIIKVEVGMNALPQGIKFTTNKNRTSFFGEAQKNSSASYETTNDDDFIAGIYVSWGYGDDRRLCTTISTLTISSITLQSIPNTESWSPPESENQYEEIHMAIVDGDGFAEGRHW